MKTPTASLSTPDSKGLRQAMQKHPLFFFFLLSYAFSWTIALPYVLSTWGILQGDYKIELALKQWVGPALAAIIMTGIMEGKPGLLGLWGRVKEWRAGWQWYAFILLGIPALVLLGVIIQPGALAGFQGFTLKVLASYPEYLVIVFIWVGLPEEIGWRGFALPRMQSRFGPMGSTLLLGVLWAFWHLLYFLLPDHGGGPGKNVIAFLTSFSIFCLMVVAITFIFTWVFNHTRGSILIAGLAHTAVDTPQVVWLPLFFDVGKSNSTVGELSVDLAGLIAFGVLALLIVIVTRGRLGYRPGSNSP